MRIVHISDTHLGFSAYRALNKESGINQREVDICNAFAQAIDKILELKPEVCLHTGDLFDSVRPSNRIVSFGLEQILKLSQAEIPTVMIAGNHSTPKMRDAGSVFRLFKLFPNLYPIYQGKYEKIDFGGLCVHAIPQCSGQEEFQKTFAQVKPDKQKKYNVIMLHAAYSGIKEFSMGEFNEQRITDKDLQQDRARSTSLTGGRQAGFDFFLLGHFHKYTKITDNAYYAGSTERMSFSEAGDDKGFLEIDLEEKQVNFHPLDIRPMIDLSPIDAKGKDAEALTKEIEKQIEENGPKDKITRLTIEDIPVPVYNSLDFKQLKRITSPALHFELRFNKEERDQIVEPPNANIGSLQREFSHFASQANLESANIDEILKLGLDYLQEASEKK